MKTLLLLLVLGIQVPSPPAANSPRDRQLYDQAREFVKAGKYPAARIELRVLLETYPDSVLTDEAKFALADSYYREGTPAALREAAAEFRDFVTFFPTSPLVPEAKQRLQEIEKAR